MLHFTLPRDLVLALIERILEHPTVVLADDASQPHEHRPEGKSPSASSSPDGSRGPPEL
jgi:hypothetical protein